MTDPLPILEVLAGDRSAQRRLYEKYLPYVLTVVRRYGIERSYEADVVQDCFAEIFRTISDYRAERGELSTWIRTISVRRTIDFLRRRPIDHLEFTTAIAQPTEEPFDLVAYGADLLLGLIAALPPGYRLVFNLYAVDGYAHAEIAELLGISEAGSRSQYSRARKLLRQQLLPHHKISTHVK